MTKSCHKYEWGMSRIYIGLSFFLWERTPNLVTKKLHLYHFPPKYDSTRSGIIFERVMSEIWMSHVICIHESLPAKVWLKSQPLEDSRLVRCHMYTYMNESLPAKSWELFPPKYRSSDSIMSSTWTSHVYKTYGWGISRHILSSGSAAGSLRTCHIYMYTYLTRYGYTHIQQLIMRYHGTHT